VDLEWIHLGDSHYIRCLRCAADGPSYDPHAVMNRSEEDAWRTWNAWFNSHQPLLDACKLLADTVRYDCLWLGKASGPDALRVADKAIAQAEPKKEVPT